VKGTRRPQPKWTNDASSPDRAVVDREIDDWEITGSLGGHWALPSGVIRGASTSLSPPLCPFDRFDFRPDASAATAAGAVSHGCGGGGRFPCDGSSCDSGSQG
jgi:hypothetical protein